MSPKFVSGGVAVLLAVLAGCQKQTPVPATPPPPKPVAVDVVKEPERSRNFLAVNKHLELGGTLYGYMDVEGDVAKVAGSLQDILAQVAKGQPAVAPFAKQDFGAIAATLGLTDIKAVGVSSVADGTGFFRNNAFLYTGGERHGLLLGLGGKPGAFTHLNLAPADTSFYAEADVDIPVVYKTIRDVVAKVAGEPMGNQMDAALRQAGQKASLSVFDLINGLKGHSAVVLRTDGAKTIRIGGPSGLALPSFALLVCVEGVGKVVDPALAQTPLLKRSESGTQHVYEFAQPSPVPELKPVIVVDGTTLYFATTREFLDECRALKTGLAQTAEFQQALARIGPEGNGLTYVHPRLFNDLRKLETLNPKLPPQAAPVVHTLMQKLPNVDRPIIAIRTNLDDGILVRSYANRSFKQEVAMVAFYNPVTVGVVAAMAIPAFQKVRQSSQEKAVMNNLRQLSAAADQYYLEHNATTTSYEALVGPEPSKYVKRINSVAGEDYRQIRFVQGQPLRVKLPDGRAVQYKP